MRGIKQKNRKVLREELEYDVDGERYPLLTSFKGLATRVPFESPLLVQRVVIPYFLQRANVVVRAFTGSGKTLSYCLPLVEMSRQADVFAIVLVPGRPLVRQVYRVVREIKPKGLKALAVCKDAGKSLLISESSKGPLVERRIDETVLKKIHKGLGAASKILVGTPESVLDLAGTVGIKGVTHLVIDEADFLINTNTIETFGSIFKAIGVEGVHVSCFSATMNEYVEEVVGAVRGATRIHVASKRRIDHEFVFGTNKKIKHLSLLQIIANGVESPTLVFVKDEETGEMLSKLLDRSGVYREGTNEGGEVLDAFRLKKIWYLFTTDSLSRGVDFHNTKSVINYDFPETKTQFVHRIGRVNRGCLGQKIYTIYSSEDFGRIRAVAEFLQENGQQVPKHIARIIEKSGRKTS